MHVGLGLGLTRGQGGGVFSPHHLYQSGDILLWYDPSDLSTMFKDTAGTQPVTADGDSVALMLDKGQWGGKTLSQVLAAQPELRTSSSVDGSSGTGSATDDGTTTTLVSGDITNRARRYWAVTGLTVGQTYKISFVLSSITAGTIGFSWSTASTLTTTLVVSTSAAGSVSAMVTATATTMYLSVLNSAAGVTNAVIANSSVSVKEIPGYHRTQATGTSMPKYKTGPNPAAAENSPELVTNGGFDSDTGWTKGAGVTIASGVLRFTSAVSGASGYQNAIPAAGAYLVTFDVLNRSAGAVSVYGPGYSADNQRNANGSYSEVITTTGAGNIEFKARGTSTLDVDNISVKEIPASASYIHWLLYDGTDDGHATGTVPFNTVTSDGLARRNLLTEPDKLDHTTWTKTRATISTMTTITASETNASGTWIGQTATGQSGNNTFSATVEKGSGFVMLTCGNNAVQANNVRVWFDTTTGIVATSQNNGSGFSVVSSSITDAGDNWLLVVTFSGNVTGQFQRLYVVDGDASIATTIERSGTVPALQFELGSTATDFQNIGTDEVAACAGAMKSSDAAAAMFAEYSANTNLNNGSFYIISPRASAEPGYEVGLRGSANQATRRVNSGYAAPISNVITTHLDIGGETIAAEIVVRINSVAVGSTTGTTTGTGNFGSYPLYFGRRGGSSLPFNGREYQTVIRSRLLSAAELSSLETFIAAKTGVIL